MKLLYKGLILFSILTFIAGVIADGNADPILRHGLKIGPILYTTGIFIWITKRYKNPILHKYDINRYRYELDASIHFILNNFMLEFWGFCAGILMLFMLNDFGFKKSEAYLHAIETLAVNENIQEEIGDFTESGALIGGTLSPKYARLGFSMYGTEGGASILVELNKDTVGWSITKLTIE